MDRSLTSNPTEGGEQSGPAPAPPAGAICNPTDELEFEIPEDRINHPGGEEENLTSQPAELVTVPPALPTDAIWNPDADMEPLPDNSESPGREAATEMEVAAPEDDAKAMCHL